ncbi:MAG: tetratricopeptide repeat protein [Gammaproteobacteria bacterium]|nr:tetratricopeptide repeat protein [Gammaproteobacteria bacterium]
MVSPNTSLRLSLLLLFALLLTACGGNKQDSKAEYFARGMELYRQGNFVKARLEFKNVLQIDPKDVESHYMFGQIEEREQDWRSAYALFTRALELDPTHVGVQIHLGRIYALAGAPDKALEAAENVLRAEPDNHAAMVLKGLASARLGQKGVAIEQAQSAVNVAPDDPDAISLLSALHADQGDLPTAIELAKRGIESNPDTLSLHILLAKLYEKSGDTDGTIATLNEMIRLQPKNLQGRMRLANYYMTKQEPERAEQTLRDAVATLPESEEAKLALVDFLDKHGETGSGERQLQQFIAESPDSYQLRLAQAQRRIKEKDLAAAQQIYERIIADAGTGQHVETARTRLAGLFVMQEQPEAAMKLIETVLSENPRQKEALLIRAALSLQGNDADKGIGDLRTILKDDPGYVKAHRLKARAHLLKNEISLARQSLESAIQAQPQEAAANIELVKLLVNIGKLDEAVETLDRVLRFAPDSLLVNEAAAKIRSRQKRWDQVAGYAEKMRQTHPESPMGYYYQGLAYQGEGRMEASNSAFEEALTRTPDATEPLIGIAQNLLQLRRPDEALSRVERAVAQNPKHYLAKNLLGEIQLARREIQQAAETFSQVIEINPKWTVPYQNLAKSKVAQGRISEAIDAIRAGYKATQDPLLGLELATYLERSGEGELAAGIYQVLLNRFPRMQAAANNYAMLLIRGAPDRQSLDKAADLVRDFAQSDNPVYMDTLGWVRLKQGQLASAIEILEKAVRANGEIPEIRYHLGVAYQQTGRLEDAKRELQRVVEAGDRFREIDRAKQLLQDLNKG